MIMASRAALVRWCVRVGLDVPGGEVMGGALLSSLAQVGFCLDMTPRDEHVRMNTREGWARLIGFMVLHGAAEEV